MVNECGCDAAPSGLDFGEFGHVSDPQGGR
jgi:hypothetical protein